MAMEPVSRVSTIALTAQLEAGLELGKMPPIVDGAPVPPPRGELLVLRDADWVCLAGPCRHYWRVANQIDNLKPHDAREVDGRRVIEPAKTYANGDPVRAFEQINHFCIPMPGIEMIMSDEVVLECNRWDPIDPEDPEQKAIVRRRKAYHDRLERETAAIRAAAEPKVDEFRMPKLLGEAVAVLWSLASRIPGAAMHVGGNHNARGATMVIEDAGPKITVTCSCGRNWIAPGASVGKLPSDARAAVIHACKIIEAVRITAESEKRK